MHNNNTQQQTFTALIQQHERLIYKVCNVYAIDAEDSKDLFQEIVLQTWQAFPRFNNQSKLSTWLYRIALNTAISHKRKQKKNASVSTDSFLDYHIEDKPGDHYAEEYKMLKQLISTLPHLEKAMILLYLEDNSYQEIAEILGISATNVGTKLARIKEKLKKQAQPLLK